jgi:hypothetical protein
MSSSLIRATALVAFALISASANAQQRPVNDTGVIACTNEAWAQVTCESVNATLPGQDAAFGRDALAVAGGLNKVGSGRRGFDLTKIGMDGSVVPANAPWGNSVGQFRCVRDNTTGLVWENYREARFWRDANPATNGGFVGAENISNSTQEYSELANTTARCNRTTWRLPTARELLSIASFETSSGLGWGDFGFLNQLTNTPISFWTSQSNPAYPEHALLVMFNRGDFPAVTRKVEGHTNKTVAEWTVLVSSQ